MSSRARTVILQGQDSSPRALTEWGLSISDCHLGQWLICKARAVPVCACCTQHRGKEPDVVHWREGRRELGLPARQLSLIGEPLASKRPLSSKKKVADSYC